MVQPVQVVHVKGRIFSGFNFTTLSATMIKFLPLDVLGVSHRILWKNENAVYPLQIPALVLEIFKLEKCVKYANEMTDDVIHSTKYINRSRASVK